MAKVLMAMSGGVDSSVAAGLLLQAGHEVSGVTLKLWGGPSDSGCCSVSDTEDARRVAHRLGIDHHVFNFGDDFQQHVVSPFVTDHQIGRTPNPCVECNRHIKFDLLLQRAQVLGFEMLATGHHARRLKQPDGSYRIARGRDLAKDQSYVLHMLNQSQLGQILLPIGELTKSELRVMAQDMGLATADKPDSQDLCFVQSEVGRKEFLGDRIPLKPARLVDLEGSEVGRVDSIEMVTLGQRRGLDLGGDSARRYVVDIDHDAGEVVVGHREDLMVKGQSIDGLAFSHEPVQGPVMVQVSAHGKPVAAYMEGRNVLWESPQKKVAAGQSMVIYHDDLVVGGGIAGVSIQG